MVTFDVSKNWVILVPPGVKAARKAAEDLAHSIRFLAGRQDGPELREVSSPGTPENGPVIILSNDSGRPEGRGFFWKLGENRIEILGQGEEGLCKGIFDFLSALGFKWPEPVSAKDSFENEILPPLQDGKIYSLKTSQTQVSGGGPATGSWKRLVIPEKSQTLHDPKKRADLMLWAIRNSFDAVVFPFDCPEGVSEETKPFALASETGGWVISRLIPRRLFLFHQELFRMEGGKRQKKIHFCPTNPGAIAILRSESKKLFQSSENRVFHLWPEQGKEDTWCSCPSCRAFTKDEQYRIAVNAIGDALAEVYPDAFISLLDSTGEEGDIPLRPNVFRINPQDIVTLRW